MEKFLFTWLALSLLKDQLNDPPFLKHDIEMHDTLYKYIHDVVSEN